MPRRLADVDLLRVVGGNAFALARAAAVADLASALRRSPHLTYAGYSAGACLTSTDLQSIGAMDDTHEFPEGFTRDMPARGLGLTGTRLIPHAGTPDADEAASRLRRAGLAFVMLADGEDLLREV